jgi:hypothetical protein
VPLAMNFFKLNLDLNLDLALIPRCTWVDLEMV